MGVDGFLFLGAGKHDYHSTKLYLAVENKKRKHIGFCFSIFPPPPSVFFLFSMG